MIGEVIKMSAAGEAADSRPMRNEVNKPNYTISVLLQVIKFIKRERERKREERGRVGAKSASIYAAFQYVSLCADLNPRHHQIVLVVSFNVL